MIRNILSKYLFKKSLKTSLSDYSFIILPGAIEGNTTSGFAFNDKDDQLNFFIKIYKINRHNIRSNKEKEILDILQKSKESKSVPRVLELNSNKYFSASIQSISSGIPIQLYSNTIDEKFFLNINRVIDFQKTLYSNSQSEKKYKKILIKKIDFFVKNFDKNLNENIIKKLKNYILSNDINLSYQHFDFNRQNILYDKEKNNYSFIDWSDTQKYSLPYHDLFFFSYSYLFQGGDKGGLKNYEDIFKQIYNNKKIMLLFKEYSKKINHKDFNYKYSLLFFFIERIIFEYKKNKTSYDLFNYFRFNMYLGKELHLNYHENKKMSIWYYLYLKNFNDILK